MRPTKVITGCRSDALPLDELIAAQEPAILKGAAEHWPLVARGRESAESAVAYLKRFDAGLPVVGYTGRPEIGGRFFYDDDVRAMNFDARRMPLAGFLDEVVATSGIGDPHSYYMGSTDLDVHLPGLRAENGFDHQTFSMYRPAVGIWIGNRTVASCHFDFSNNVACNLIGHRRFTLFPPAQVANLYPGPLEPTPGGQVVSMVDFRAPDFDRFPRFRDALQHAQVAELDPGDLLIYPAMWWHHVEALDSFNVMINYWWNAVPAFVDSPMTTMLHGMLSLRDRPTGEKAAWRALFDYYLFDDGNRAGDHLPEHARGPLAPLDEIGARRLRAELLRRLNR
jgi:hypothetical protein